MTQVNVNREGRREDDEAAGGVAGAVGGGVLGAAVGGPVGAAAGAVAGGALGAEVAEDRDRVEVDRGTVVETSPGVTTTTAAPVQAPAGETTTTNTISENTRTVCVPNT